MRLIVLLLSVPLCGNAQFFKCKQGETTAYQSSPCEGAEVVHTDQINRELTCKGPNGVMSLQACPKELSEPLQSQLDAEEETRIFDREFAKLCNERGYSQTYDCINRQRAAYERLKILEDDPRDGPAVGKCVARWRLPGRKFADYSQAEHCVTIEVASRNK